ncbi:Melibiase-domain-containing protein [Myxozyma melibiosi]|uniref:Alpha-galactosidase n=1 Tax=Myxozyma melibiosi TaxID=54550 RepID=A0ABR1FBZ7_9ASCO
MTVTEKKQALSVGQRFDPIVVRGNSFSLNGSNVSYRFHVDSSTGDLLLDHFGGRVTEDPLSLSDPNHTGWALEEHLRREFPDNGRGDFRVPAMRIRHTDSHSLSKFEYKSYTIVDGKPALQGLPSTFSNNGDAETLVIHMFDSRSCIRADLCYTIFPENDAIVRSVKLSNESDETVVIDKLASLSVDFPFDDYDMIQLRGEWFRECTRDRRKVEYGTQGFGNSTGFSSHHHNPFLGIVSQSTTEFQGTAWGFSLVYSGSFKAEVERAPQGLSRVQLGVNPSHLSWKLGKGESFTTPECVAVFSDCGVGDMSRKFHRLYRHNLITSKFVDEPRPVLLNGWESIYFNFDQNRILELAQETAKLGAKLFVMDDGWFGVKYPRVNDMAGLGDWEPNPDRFPDGLKALVDKVTDIQSNALPGQESSKLKFGIWVEPEMVSPKSVLYHEHPDWALSADDYPRTECRNQLILNLALTDVQDYIINAISKLLRSASIFYVKWDLNRGIHESPTPDHHSYILGLYRVLHELTTRFPDVLFEGCGSGGGRFDPGMLHYFPQIWTSDCNDALDRISIQLGTSVVYPASTMGAHISVVPNEVTLRTTPIKFRAHVAMMGGSFGLELDPVHMPEDDKAEVPGLIALAEKINPIVIRGDMYRLNLPGESNYPSVLFISDDSSQLVLFVFQIRATSAHNFPRIRLQGLQPSSLYMVDGEKVYSGLTLMNGGVQYRLNGDCDSRVVFIERL